MAEKFKRLSFLWLIIAFLVPSSTTSRSVGSSTPTVTSSTTSVPVGSSTPTVPSSTTSGSVGSSTPTVPSSTTKPVLPSSTTSVPSSTTKPVPPSSTTSVPSSTTSGSFGSSTPTVPSSTTSGSVGSSTPTVPSSTTSGPVGSSTPTVPSSTTSGSVGSSTPTVPSSTTSGPVGSSTPTVPSSTTKPVPPSSTTSVPSSTTKPVPPSSTTSVPSSTTKPVPPSSTTSVPSSTTSGSVGSSTPTVPSSTTSGSVGSSTPTVPSSTTSGSVGSSTPTVPSSTTSGSVGSSTPTVPSSTTKPVPPSSTTSGSVGSSTPTVPSSTTSGSVGSSTPTVSSSTTSGSVGSSTPTVPSSTTSGSVGSSTPTVPSSTQVPPSSPTLVPELPGPCNINPCGKGSTCENRGKESFVCLCLPGDNYNYKSKNCENAKVFPGELDLPQLFYDDKMSVKTSEVFKETAQNITNELAAAFSGSADYSNSTVLELLSTERNNVRSRPRVTASVEIIFNANSNITLKEVEKQMLNASTCNTSILAGASFDDTDLCDRNPCDEKTAQCKSGNGSYECTCFEKYIRTNYSSRICIACPSGQQVKDSFSCENCPFGRSGFNCNEPWQLVLAIVGPLLGGLLLIALILLPVLALRSSKKSSKQNKNADIGMSYVNHSLAKAPLIKNSSMPNSQAPSINGSAYGSPGVPRIPRATTSSWNSSTNLKMASSNSQQNPIPVGRNSRRYDNQDDWNQYTQSRPRSNLYDQARPQNNPYAQSQPQLNPYAQRQGQSNPYYVHDNERRLN